MSRQTFTWHPSWGSEVSPKYNVTVLRFGDDYEQRQVVGLNRVKEEWTLKFEQTHIEGNKIDDFLRARGGHESFNWTNPRGVKIVAVCETHTVTRYS